MIHGEKELLPFVKCMVMRYLGHIMRGEKYIVLQDLLMAKIKGKQERTIKDFLVKDTSTCTDVRIRSIWITLLGAVDCDHIQKDSCRHLMKLKDKIYQMDKRRKEDIYFVSVRT